MEKRPYSGAPTGDFVARVFDAILDHSSDGLILLCAERRVLSCNRVAQEILAAGAQLRLLHGRLAAAQPGDTSRLQRAIALAEGGGSGIVLGDPIDGGVLRVVVIPLAEAPGIEQWSGNARTALLLKHGARPIRLPGEVLREAFGLTERESMLAIHLAEGGDLSSFADRNGLSINTVRPYLKLVFEKTGTHRQVELVRLLASLAL
jgi:DNA-binding CsgD family transcriptional regulator